MLAEIETKLANKKIGAAEKWRLRLRAGIDPTTAQAAMITYPVVRRCGRIAPQ